MNTWKERKDKRLKDKLKENEENILQFKPSISENSKLLWEQRKKKIANFP